MTRSQLTPSPVSLDRGTAKPDLPAPPQGLARGDSRAPILRTAWRAPLGAHVLALAVIFIGLFAFMSPRATFTSDEGAYALQVNALRHGSWAYSYNAAPLDPGRDYFPVQNSVRNGNDFFVYIQHPAYSVLLWGAAAVFGTTVGLHVPALAGTLLAAIAAWLLMGEIAPRLRRPAFWLVAASPLLVNGYLIWAHTLSAAVAGLTLVAVVRRLRRGASVGRNLAVAAGLAAGVLIRSEGVLFAAAAAIGTLVVGWDRTAAVRVGRKIRAAARDMALFAIPTAIAVTAEHIWVRAIVGGAYRNLDTRSDGAPYMTGRVNAMWHDLVGGLPVPGAGGVLSIAALAGVAGLGYLALRRWDADSMGSLWAALALGVGSTAVQVVWHPIDAPAGLFTLWSVALVGLMLVPWRSVGPEIRLLGIASAVFALAVVATEWADGGGLEVGGRFFFPLLAPLTVLAVTGLDRSLSAIPRHARHVATGILVALATAGVAAGVVPVQRARAG